MTGFFRNSSLAFSSGSLGGLANAVAIWLLGSAGILTAAEVSIPYHLSLSIIYMRVVWGGIWGFCFLLPFPRDRVLTRGLACSVAPSLVQLLYIFPEKAGKGILGHELGLLTPVFVLFFNAVWGVAASLWLWIVENR